MKKRNILYTLLAIGLFATTTLFNAQQAEAYHHGCMLTNLGEGTCHDESQQGGHIHCDPGPAWPGDLGPCEFDQN